MTLTSMADFLMHLMAVAAALILIKFCLDWMGE